MPNRRQAFTAIDLVTALCLVAILVGLLLPSIQQAREAARRTVCATRLGQLGLALNSYHQAFGMLPPGVVNPTGPIDVQKSGYHMGWIVQILPHLGKPSLYRRVDFSKSIYANENSFVATFSYEQLTCPSTITRGGDSSFAGCYNDVESPIDVDNNGVLYLNSSVSWDDMVDGRSNTLYAGEKDSAIGVGLSASWASGTGASLRNAERPLSTAELMRRVQSVAGQTPVQSANGALGVGSFAGWHGGLINVCLGDGSVRQIREDIDPIILQRLANRKDTGIVGDF